MQRAKTYVLIDLKVRPEAFTTGSPMSGLLFIINVKVISRSISTILKMFSYKQRITGMDSIRGSQQTRCDFRLPLILFHQLVEYGDFKNSIISAKLF